jgi:hypothetical protein
MTPQLNTLQEHAIHLQASKVLYVIVVRGAQFKHFQLGRLARFDHVCPFVTRTVVDEVAHGARDHLLRPAVGAQQVAIESIY